jgi:hypothetical protein
MELKCSHCNASLFKSYGGTYKLRSRSVRWDSLADTAVAQCNLCRSFNELPLELKIESEKLIIHVGTQIRKSTTKEKLVIKKDKISEKSNKGK